MTKALLILRIVTSEMQDEVVRLWPASTDCPQGTVYESSLVVVPPIGHTLVREGKPQCKSPQNSQYHSPAGGISSTTCLMW